MGGAPNKFKMIHVLAFSFYWVTLLQVLITCSVSSSELTTNNSRGGGEVPALVEHAVTVGRMENKQIHTNNRHEFRLW